LAGEIDVSAKGNKAEQILISIFKKIMPPILEPLAKSFYRILKFRHRPENSKPEPKSYTTTANPVEVPVQKEAYFLALNNYVEDGDRVLDVGCGLGYGINLLSIKAKEVVGVDVDQNAIDYCFSHIHKKNPKLSELYCFDGYHLPFADRDFDVVTCVDVIEHVEFYLKFIEELIRVSKRVVFFSTPNRRPEYTNPDGTPKNYYHLREWNYIEFNDELRSFNLSIKWQFINGAYDGPFLISDAANEKTQAIVPALILPKSDHPR
jgi:SAM-dependent methyltransferase